MWGKGGASIYHWRPIENQPKSHPRSNHTSQINGNIGALTAYVQKPTTCSLNVHHTRWSLTAQNGSYTENTIK